MATMNSPQIEAVRAWLRGDEHADHDTFSMGKLFAQALIEQIDQMAAALEDVIFSNIKTLNWNHTDASQVLFGLPMREVWEDPFRPDLRELVEVIHRQAKVGGR